MAETTNTTAAFNVTEKTGIDLTKHYTPELLATIKNIAQLPNIGDSLAAATIFVLRYGYMGIEADDNGLKAKDRDDIGIVHYFLSCLIVACKEINWNGSPTIQENLIHSIYSAIQYFTDDDPKNIFTLNRIYHSFFAFMGTVNGGAEYYPFVYRDHMECLEALTAFIIQAIKDDEK